MFSPKVKRARCWPRYSIVERIFLSTLICSTPGSLSIHLVAEVYLGLPLLHSLDLEELAGACAEERRDDFLFVVAPLKIAGATGSPVAPVCVL